MACVGASGQGAVLRNNAFDTTFFLQARVCNSVFMCSFVSLFAYVGPWVGIVPCFSGGGVLGKSFDITRKIVWKAPRVAPNIGSNVPSTFQPDSIERRRNFPARCWPQVLKRAL